MGFQTQVNINPASGVVGDFASDNPRHTLLAGKAQHKVGAGSNVVIGSFAEVDAKTGLTVATLTGKNPLGFVGRRSNMGVITTWLAESSLALNQGQPVTLYDSGDFYVALAGATYGQEIKVDTTGAISTSGTIDTGFKVAVPTDSSGLAVITRNILITTTTTTVGGPS